ncbi:hypothetical protein BV22DRAFT_1041852 [Leucogyrophana mollusca]|uniref:Uncharacterized protein n=1 Tax=Leucogyrophana mollusca TaxID=85980 RepID=A0ACB8AZ85_9AGAM|nr:hypothetical protein BV22DRAFT_1041852 [Leucogyrophana mollusca]
MDTAITSSLNSGATLENLCPDVIYVVTSFLSALDVIRLRQTCRFFREVLDHRVIWSDLYQRIRLPRPAGPFFGQSAPFLRDAVVATTKLERNWRPSSPYIADTSCATDRSSWSCRTTVVHRAVIDRWTPLIGLAFGRWLLIVDDDGVRCFDIVLHMTTTIYSPRSKIARFACVATPPDHSGQVRTFVVIQEQNRHPEASQSIINVFRVIPPEDGAIGGTPPPYTVAMNIIIQTTPDICQFTKVSIGPRLLHIYCDGVEPVASRALLIVDVLTLQLYKLPRVANELYELNTTMASFVSTDTHLLATYASSHPGRGPTTIQAFEIPPPSDAKPEPQILRLSHGGAVRTIRFQVSQVVRGPVTDPSTEEIHLTVIGSTCRKRYDYDQKVHLIPVCVKLMPPLSRLSRRGLILCACESSLLVPGTGADGIFEPAFDGYTRGVYVDGLRLSGLVFDDETSPKIITGRLPVALGNSNILVVLVAFDGVKGRLCYAVWGLQGSYVEVADFA